ncbi:MAG: phosphopantetheine adenylyltransferase [Thermoplasmataceae archaeon]
MKVIVAGTFTILHDGHKALLDAVLDLNMPIIVGLTADAFIKKSKPYGIIGFEKRKEIIEKYLRGRTSDFVIRALNSTEGDSTSETSYTHIVVSEETVGNARRINEKRVQNNLNPLIIITVPVVLARDLLPISSRRIMRGEIDEHGRVMKPIYFAVNSTWQPFFAGARSYLEKDFGEINLEFKVLGNGFFSNEFYPDNYKLATDEAAELVKLHDFAIGLCIGVRGIPSKGILLMSICAAVIDKIGRIHFGESQSIEFDESLKDSVGIHEKNVTDGNNFLIDNKWVEKSIIGALESSIISFRNNASKDFQNQMLNLE